MGAYFKRQVLVDSKFLLGVFSDRVESERGEVGRATKLTASC